MSATITHRELAELCRDSYSDIHGAQQIGAMGPCCWVVEPVEVNDPVILVFRGTDDLAGWIQDARAPMVSRPGMQVHAGFQTCWEYVRRQVINAIGDHHVIVTGHSLGGAMATLAAHELAKAGHTVLQSLTFRSPPFCDS